MESGPPAAYGGERVPRWNVVTCNLRGKTTKYLYKTPWEQGGYDDYDAWRVYSNYLPEFDVGKLTDLEVRIGGRLVASVRTATHSTLHRTFRDTTEAYMSDYQQGHFQLDIQQNTRKTVSLLLCCGWYQTKDEYYQTNLDSLQGFQEGPAQKVQILMISFVDHTA